MDELAKKIAVLVPCFNEEQNIRSVIEGFRSQLPGAEIVVCDNASTDKTAEVALQYGARLLREERRGKGNAIRKALKEITADYYIMTDGDATYDPAAAPSMIKELMLNKGDVVYGVRLQDGTKASVLRACGNRLFTLLTNISLGKKLSDVLTGYRAFTREYAKNFPCQSSGFEIETEMNIYTAKGKFRHREIQTYYSERKNNAESKLRVFRDGARIMFAILYFSICYQGIHKKIRRA